MKKYFICLNLIIYHLVFVKIAQSQNENQELSSSQDIKRVEIRNSEMWNLTSAFNGQTYEIDVFLPRGYNPKTSRLPVIYVLDAEYNFGCVAYITSRLIKNGDIPPVIVVGIAYNTGYDEYYALRERDCTPPSKINGLHSGGVEKFVKFLSEELFPFIDKKYKTLPGNRTIVGHSIGGFFCTYSLFEHPELFSKYIIVSPSYWFSGDVIFSYEQTYASNHKELNAAVYLSTGKKESDRMIRTTQQMISVLNKRNYMGLIFKSFLPEDEHHRSIFPLAYTHGLQWLFGKENIGMMKNLNEE